MTTYELQRGQELLREEVNQLKTQMSLVMEILQALLRKEGSLTPTIVTRIVSPLHLPGFTLCHGLSHGYHPKP